jgi:hypothetical protein
VPSINVTILTVDTATAAGIRKVMNILHGAFTDIDNTTLVVTKNASAFDAMIARIHDNDDENVEEGDDYSENDGYDEDDEGVHY